MHGQNVAVGAVVQSIHVLEETTADVYDIHVDYCHNFFANGILVHNCIDGVRYCVLEEILGKNSDYLDLDDVLSILP